MPLIVSFGALLKFSQLFRKGFTVSPTTGMRQGVKSIVSSTPAHFQPERTLKDRNNGSGLLLMLLFPRRKASIFLGGLNFPGRTPAFWEAPTACLVALIITMAPLCMIPYLQPHIIHISPKLSHRRSTQGFRIYFWS